MACAGQVRPLETAAASLSSFDAVLPLLLIVLRAVLPLLLIVLAIVAACADSSMAVLGLLRLMTVGTRRNTKAQEWQGGEVPVSHVTSA